MVTEDGAKGKCEPKVLKASSESSFDEHPPTHIKRVGDQILPEDIPAISTWTQSCALSPLKSPPSFPRMTSPKEISSSCPPLLNVNEESPRKLQHEDQHFSQQQQQDDENDDSQGEKEQNSDSDLSSINGKTEGNRRLREFVPDVQKDEAYWEKRRKNNEAARRSREKRRINDIVLAGRMNVLEQDNSRLRRELMALKKKFHLPDGNLYNYKHTASRESNIHKIITSQPSSSVTNTDSLSRPNKLLGPQRKSSSQIHHISPPPLLAVTDNMPMGLAVFSSAANSGLPYLVSEAANLNHNSYLKTRSSALAIGLHQYHNQPIPRQQSCYPSYIKEAVKDIKEDRDVAVRDRTINNVEGLPLMIDPSLMAMFKRNNVFSYPQYCHPLCSPNSEINPYSYSNFNTNQANNVYHFENAFDNHSQLQTSPVYNHSSDDNYDEPLKLTVRRDSTIPKINWDSTDKHIKESASNATMGEKQQVAESSSVPLNLRHKPVLNEVVIPSPLFPAALPSSCSSFQDRSFLNGLTNLPDHGLPKAIPLSLVTSELPFPISQSKFAPVKYRQIFPGSKSLDPVYLERRRKNNEAARKCRENQKYLIKLKEVKSTCLETENNKLQVEMTSLQNEMKQLRELFRGKPTGNNAQQELNIVES